MGHKDGFDLFRCGACQTVVVNPYPTDEELATFYAGYQKTEKYLRKKNKKIRRSLGRVVRMILARPPGKRFLDVGCSVGYMVAAAKKLGRVAKGIDIDGQAVAIATEHFGDHFEQISIQDLAARGDRFDMVYACEVIEHVRDPDGFMAAVSQAMAPDAILYVTAPDGGHKKVPEDFASWDMVCPPEHLTYFTRAGLRHLLERHGLRIEKFQLALKPGMKAIARKAS